jgi:hypothetical protein
MGVIQTMKAYLVVKTNAFFRQHVLDKLYWYGCSIKEVHNNRTEFVAEINTSQDKLKEFVNNELLEIRGVKQVRILVPHRPVHHV